MRTLSYLLQSVLKTLPLQAERLLNKRANKEQIALKGRHGALYTKGFPLIQEIPPRKSSLSNKNIDIA